MTTPSINEVFGSYRLTHLLGKGGMASVYRAVRSGPMGFAKQVAIKRLHPSLTRDSAILKALVNEARIGGQLKHPNIVEIYEFNRVGDTYYLAMEFIDGWTLDRVIQIGRANQQALPNGVALDMAIQVCEGLHYAHTLESLDGVEVHLVHRDLKPANIIVGRDGVTKIMDFGIAKADTNLFKTTLVDTTKGTPHYMSPEQVGGDPQLGATSDIFAMGSLLYELVTEKVLFAGDSLAAVLFAVSRAEVSEQIEDVEEAMPGFGAIVARCLEKDPAKRFPSAKALQEALERFQASREPEPWTTKNFMYTLRSKLLEAGMRSEPSDSEDEMDFAPLLSSADLGLTDEVSVEEARAAADAEISKLQSQYISEAMTGTAEILQIDEPSFADTMLPDSSRDRGQAASSARGPSQRALIILLGMALIITLSVVAMRINSQAPPAEMSASDSMSAVKRGAEVEVQAPPAIPTVAPSTKPSTSKPVATKKAPKRATPVQGRNEITETANKTGHEPAIDSKSAPAVTVVAPIGVGMLGVRPSTPSSVVYIDDKKVGKTPLMPIELSAGKHTVRLHCATGGINASKSISVNIEDGKTLKLGKYDFNKQEWK
jgi:serine/threonine-protein kinase